MKTAISIPDSLFRKADEMAKHLSLSRSQLYVRAIEEFLLDHDSSRVREALDVIYAEEDSDVDPQLASMQLASQKKR